MIDSAFSKTVDSGVVTRTVPDLMVGCWRRAWIESADSTRDDTTTVVWLQTESSMVDVRVSGDRTDVASCIGFHDCTMGQLRLIAASDGSSGFTECSPIDIGEDGRPSATARWHTRGHGVNFQPVSAFPEPGLMTWNDDATIMTERAPSGAYVEEWRLVPGSRDTLTVIEVGDAAVYRAGPIAVLVRDRRVPVPRLARLPELLDDYQDDRAMAEALLDCEFSVAEQRGTNWIITASTLPWREGKELDVDLG